MQSVSYIRDCLNALQLHKKAEKTEDLYNQTDVTSLKKIKYLIHCIDKLILTHRPLFGQTDFSNLCNWFNQFYCVMLLKQAGTGQFI